MKTVFAMLLVTFSLSACSNGPETKTTTVADSASDIVITSAIDSISAAAVNTTNTVLDTTGKMMGKVADSAGKMAGKVAEKIIEKVKEGTEKAKTVADKAIDKVKEAVKH